MNDIFVQALGYLVSIWRRRWYIVAISWLFCGAGWTMVSSMPDKYESSARLYVDMDTMLAPLMRGIAVEMNLFQQIEIMQKTLLSRPNLEKVVLMTDLDLSVKTDAQKEALLDALARKITILQQGRNLFTVAYQDTDPNLTKRVVQAVLQIFVESNLGMSRKDMDTTRRFLDGQIKEYERELEEAENRLANFKRKNLGLLPGEGTYYENIQRARAELQRTEASITEGITVRDELKAQLAALPQFLEVAGDAAGSVGLGGTSGGPESDLQARIFDLEKSIDSLLVRYTDKHPDVVAARRQIKSLKQQLAEEQKAAAAAFEAGGEAAPGTGKTLMPNPVHEQVKLQLVQQEAAIAALKSRSEKSREELANWEKMGQLIPQVEAELVKLNRDYGIIKQGYDELRKRKESARLASDLETKAQKVQFRVIDPPIVPIKPSGPNRPMFLTVVLLAGIGAGVAFAFVLGQITTTFHTVQRLQTAFALPIVGSVSAILSPTEERRHAREMLGFGVAGGCLVVAFVGLIAINLGAGGGIGQTVKGIAQSGL
jgi:polysaccharide chain length determinant protein (PEP-CTERM system associated)